MAVFQAERAVSPLDGSVLWVMLDPQLVVHREASDFRRAVVVLGAAVGQRLEEAGMTEGGSTKVLDLRQPVPE